LPPLNPGLPFLLNLLAQAYDQRSWHGPNLRGSLRGVSAEGAAWRPGPARHNVHEIALHAAYWKYVVRRHLTGETRGSFPLKGSNWLSRPVTGTAAEWKGTLELLSEVHESFTEAVAAFDAARLAETPARSRFSNLDMITGAAAHDLYHAGQIQLLKRLREG